MLYNKVTHDITFPELAGVKACKKVCNVTNGVASWQYNVNLAVLFSKNVDSHCFKIVGLYCNKLNNFPPAFYAGCF